jgi:hypothetical protein
MSMKRDRHNPRGVSTRVPLPDASMPALNALGSALGEFHLYSLIEPEATLMVSNGVDIMVLATADTELIGKIRALIVDDAAQEPLVQGRPN